MRIERTKTVAIDVELTDEERNAIKTFYRLVEEIGNKVELSDYDVYLSLNEALDGYCIDDFPYNFTLYF